MHRPVCALLATSRESCGSSPRAVAERVIREGAQGSRAELCPERSREEKACSFASKARALGVVRAEERHGQGVRAVLCCAVPGSPRGRCLRPGLGWRVSEPAAAQGFWSWAPGSVLQVPSEKQVCWRKRGRWCDDPATWISQRSGSLVPHGCHLARFPGIPTVVTSSPTFLSPLPRPSPTCHPPL